MSETKNRTQAWVYPVSLIVVVVAGHYWFHWSDITVVFILALVIGGHELEKVTDKLEQVTDKLDIITDLVKAASRDEVKNERTGPKCPTCDGALCIVCGKACSEDYADCPACGRHWTADPMCGQRWTEAYTTSVPQEPSMPKTDQYSVTTSGPAS